MGGGAPLRQDDAGHQVEVQRRGLCGGEVVGDQDTCGRHLARGLAGQGPQHLLAHRTHVRGALAQVGVGQPRPLGLDVGQAARPRGYGSEPAREASLDVGQHLGVGEQRQVGVEDAGLGGAHLARGHDPGVLDLPASRRHRLHDATPVRSGLGRGLLPLVEDCGVVVSLRTGPIAIPGDAGRGAVTSGWSPCRLIGAEDRTATDSSSTSSNLRVASVRRCSTASCA